MNDATVPRGVHQVKQDNHVCNVSLDNKTFWPLIMSVETLGDEIHGAEYAQRPFIFARLQNSNLQCLYDTGAAVCCISTLRVKIPLTSKGSLDAETNDFIP